MARYVFHEVLGRGGMGIVHRATQVELGRDVALKILADEVAADTSNCRRFIREIEALMALQHPHIIRIYDCGQLDGRWFFAMEMLEGPSLERLRTQAGPLDPGRALRLVRQLCDALAHCHAHGIVHRDVKPANVIVRSDDHLTLMDFGIARIRGATVVTAEDTVIGTPRYIAPEILSGHPPSPASDVYALGVTLYELLSPTPPFCSPEVKLVLGLILRGAVEPLLERRPDVHPVVVDLVARAMARPHAKRPTAAGLVTAIDRALQGLRRPTGRVRPLPTPTPAPAPVRSWWRTLLPLAGGTILMAGLGGWWALGRHGGERPPAATPRVATVGPAEPPPASPASAASGVIDPRLAGLVAVARQGLSARQHTISDIWRDLMQGVVFLDLKDAARRAREVVAVDGIGLEGVRKVVAAIEARGRPPGSLSPPQLEFLARAYATQIPLGCRVERCRRMVVVFERAAAEGRDSLSDGAHLAAEFEAGIALGEDSASLSRRYLDVLAAHLAQVAVDPHRVGHGILGTLEDVMAVSTSFMGMPWVGKARRSLETHFVAFLITMQDLPPPAGPPLAQTVAGLWSIAAHPGRPEPVRSAREGLKRLAALWVDEATGLQRLEDRIARERAPSPTPAQRQPRSPGR